MMQVIPAMATSSVLHSQLAAIMETMACSALTQISKLVEEESVKLRFDMSKALFTNSALSDKVKKLESELASRGSSRTVGVQTDVSAAPILARKDWCVNPWEDGDPLLPDTVTITDVPHTSQKSTNTLSDPFTVTENKCEDAELNAAIISQQELISAQEHGESTSTEPEQLFYCYSTPDSDYGLSFDPEGESFDYMDPTEDPSMQLIHCDTEEAFSTHVIPIEEDEEDDYDDDDYVPFGQGSQHDTFMAVGPGGPSISRSQKIPPYKGSMGTTKGKGYSKDTPDVAMDRTSQCPRFRCRVCKRSFFYKQTLTNHMKAHTSNFCKICQQHFPKRTKYKPHICVPKLPLKSFLKACHICGKLFPNPSSLRLHAVVHTGEKPYRCSLCGKGFTQKGNLKCHIRIHTGERPFHCNICGRTFIQKNNLTTHMMSHRKSQKKGLQPAPH